MITSRVLLVFAVVLTMLFASGCASLFNEPVPPEDVSEVTGTYQIRHFEFVPTSSAIEPIDLLEYVQSNRSQLELTQSQDFILTYQTREEEQVKLTGPFELTADNVQLNGQEKDSERYERIMLDRTLALSRTTPNTLSLEKQTEISPELLSPEYQGLNEVEGTLRLEFVLAEESPFTFR